MQTPDDMELLRQYAAEGNDPAFEELVSRRVRFVYASALRQVRDPHMAEEITQSVFIILARKAGQIHRNTLLMGWLFKTTRFVALAQMRAGARRLKYEKEAQLQNEPQSHPGGADPGWQQMSPMLDEAISHLGEKDRLALLLRFFENKTLAEVGAQLGTGEDPARMRVNRALEKLRKFFLKRGVVTTAALIAGAIAANSIAAEPVTGALAKSVAGLAIAKGTTASESTLTIIKGATKLMAWTKAKVAVLTGVGLLVAAGTTVGVVKYQSYEKRLDSWRIPNLTAKTLSNVEPQVRILPTKFKDPVYRQVWAPQDKYAGVRVRAIEIARIAYRWTEGRIYFPDGEPKGRFDFATTIRESPKEGLQKEIRKQFGLVGKIETMERDVLLLRVKTPNAPGLKPHLQGSRSDAYFFPEGRIVNWGRPISTTPPELPLGLPKLLESFVEMPVLDETGFGTNRFDIDIRWEEKHGEDWNHEALKKVLMDQLGMELVPDKRPIEMLVMARAK